MTCYVAGFIGGFVGALLGVGVYAFAVEWWSSK